MTGVAGGRWPNLFVLGAPKCGTTSLTHWMAQHPGIWMSQPKEPGYFNDDYKDGHFRRRPKRYQRLFATDRPFQWYCDGTVDYLASQVAVARILRASLDARFIVAVRQHADLIASMHQEERISGNELIADLAKAYELCPERRVGRRIPITRPEPKKIDYMKRASIGEQLARAIQLINRDRILVVDFQLIRDDPERVWQELCVFLDLAPLPVDMSPQNRRQTVASVPGTILRKYMRRAKRGLGLTRDFGLSRPLEALSVRDVPKAPQLDPALRARFDADFASDLAVLRQVVRAGRAVIAPGGWLDHD